MDFIDQLKQYAKKVESMKDALQTEEATKTALIMPFFQMLGYDVFNPQEFMPEFTADVGIKKGEKVDYAILQNGQPVILIECKSITENLDRHGSQLFRYFGTTNAKFAILTNGQYYRFYTDLDKPNLMDDTPFLTINVLDIRENQVPELKKFCKSQFDMDSIFNRASELKYVHDFKETFVSQLENPSDDFVRFFLQSCYSGKKNQNVIEQFRPILKKALNDAVSEMMNDKIKSALGGSGGSVSVVEQKTPDEPVTVSEAVEEPKPKAEIVTTEEELEAYFLIKNMLSDLVSVHDITYKDTLSYINILYKGNTRKRICRLRFTSSAKILYIPTADGGEAKYQIEDVYDLKKYKDSFALVLQRYMKK